MAGDGISVVEMRMLGRIELDGSTIFETEGDVAIGVNFLDLAQFAVCDSEVLIGCGELNAVPDREFSFCFAIDADAREPFRIVRDLVPASLFNRQEIIDWS